MAGGDAKSAGETRRWAHILVSGSLSFGACVMHQANPEEIQARVTALLGGAAGTPPSLGLLWSASPFPLLSRFQSPWFCTSVSGSFSGERGSPFHSQCLSLGHLCLSLASLPPNVASSGLVAAVVATEDSGKKGHPFDSLDTVAISLDPDLPPREGRCHTETGHLGSLLVLSQRQCGSVPAQLHSYTGLSLLLQFPASWFLLCLCSTHPTPGIKRSTGDQKMTKTQAPQTHILVGKTVEKVLS